jgi:hypothetical protein
MAWKAATQTFRIVDRKVLARIVAIVASFTLAASSLSRTRGLAAVLGMFAVVGAAGTILLVPQALRIDLRQDLQHLDLLKTWPLRAASIVRGEIIWPGAIVITAVWTLLGIAALTSASMLPRVSTGARLSVVAAAAALAPSLVFAQLAIHNAVALMFPAWVPLGMHRPRGLDAMGQRLIILAGTWLMLGLIAVPGAVPGGLVWFALSPVIGTWAMVFGAVVCSSVVGVEVLLATEALGPAYDRLDISSVERGE